MDKKNYVLLGGMSFIIFLIAGIYITFPLIFHFGDLVTGLGDEIVIAWIQNWVIHVVTTDPFSLFNANIYYPYTNSLAFSDIFFTSALISFIPFKLIKEPIVVVNFTLISSLLLLGFSTYLLIFYLTKDFFASVLGGILIIFSPATLDKIVHLQALTVYLVPLAVLFFIIFLKTKRSLYLLLSITCFILQTYNSFLPGYFIIFSYIIIFLFFLFQKTLSISLFMRRKNILFVVLAVLLIIPIAIPYYKVSNEFNYTRDIRDTIHFALQPEDLYYPNQYTRLQQFLLAFSQPDKYPQNASFKPGYIGAVFSISSVIAIILFFRNFKKNSIFFNSFTSIALFGLLLSFGPALHINRVTIHEPFPVILPYAFMYYVVPGFQGFRNSARWEMLFVIFIAVTIALVFTKALKKYNIRIKILIYFIFIILVIAEYNFPMNFVKAPKINEFPQVYSWLNTTPKNSTIVEMPIYNWYMQPYVSHERMREFYSTVHFRKMMNGASGFSPPPWQNLVVDILENFPSDKSIKKLRNLKINYVLVHKDEYDLLYKDKFKVNGNRIKKGDEIISALLANSSINFIKRFDNTYIFSLN